MNYWRHYDPPTEDRGGMIATPAAEAREWNAKDFGIFWTVNEFAGARRIANCTRIRAWAIDLDDGTKAQQRERIEASPVIPSGIVESKNGYHVYWFAKDGTIEFYRLLATRLAEHFGADIRARDVARVLRVPGYWHCKDPGDRFAVRWAYGPHKDRRYHERELFRLFGPSRDELRRAEQQAWHEQQRASYGQTGDLWDRIYNLDQSEALRRLSGSGYVGGEVYTFRPTRAGKQNIRVNGKGTSCWIDAERRIGSADKGGPTVIQWLAWFGLSKPECVRIVKELFPEIEGDA